jgi:hypothetical protein
MHRLKPKLNVGGVFAYLLVYASWFLTTMLGLLSIFYTRNVLNVLGPVLGARSGTHPAILDARLRFFDRLGMFAILIVWAAYALFAEHRYRSSIDAARHRQFTAETASADQAAATRKGLWGHLREWGVDILARRFLITTSIPAVLFGLVYLIQAIVFLVI